MLVFDRSMKTFSPPPIYILARQEHNRPAERLQGLDAGAHHGALWFFNTLLRHKPPFDLLQRLPFRFGEHAVNNYQPCEGKKSVDQIRPGTSQD